MACLFWNTAGFAIGIAGNQLITRVKPIQELLLKKVNNGLKK
ncbi:hypothetical protein QK911_05905 [Lactococcus lactis]